MNVSERISNVFASPIRKLSPYAAAAKAAGKKVYHLNIGQPDIQTPPAFLEAIRAFDDSVIAYGDSRGDARLLDAIQKYYHDCRNPKNKRNYRYAVTRLIINMFKKLDYFTSA